MREWWDYKIANVTSVQLQNHVPSAFNLNVTFRTLVPRYRGTTWNLALSLSSPSLQITQPVRRGTMKSRFLNPGPYASPLERLALFPDRARWYDSRGGSRGAHRTMSITVRDFSSRSYCSSLLPLRGLFCLRTRTAVRRSRIERRVRNREEKESTRPDTFRNTCDASWPLPRREPQKYFDWITSWEFRYPFAALPVTWTHNLAVPKNLRSSSSSSSVPPKLSNHLSFLFSHDLRNHKIIVLQTRHLYLRYLMIDSGKFLILHADFTLKP